MAGRPKHDDAKENLFHKHGGTQTCEYTQKVTCCSDQPESNLVVRVPGAFPLHVLLLNLSSCSTVERACGVFYLDKTSGCELGGLKETKLDEYILDRIF